MGRVPSAEFHGMKKSDEGLATIERRVHFFYRVFSGLSYILLEYLCEQMYP
jgi:hypothetical protein